MDDKIVIGGNMSLRNVISGNARFDSPVSGQTQPVMVHNTGTYNHAELFNRDVNDQHPIEAITSLSAELNTRPSEHLTNLEIFAIVNA